MRSMTFTLDPLPPFRLDLTVWTLRRRLDNAIDRWDGQTYQRLLALDGEPVEIAVTQAGDPGTSHLRVRLTGPRLSQAAEIAARAALDRLLGLRVDLSAFYAFAAGDTILGPLAQRFRGAKPPRFPSVFEALVNAIACQQITLTQGIHLLNRLSAAHGQTASAIPAPSGTSSAAAPAYAFPRPRDLAGADPRELRALGFSQNKVRALTEAAAAVAAGTLELEALAELDDADALTRLLPLRGVGRWTAEYVLLRGLGRLHVFPGDDVGARNNLRRWLHLPEPLDYTGVASALASWRQYGGLIYFHLLMDRLAAAGAIHA